MISEAEHSGWISGLSMSVRIEKQATVPYDQAIHQSGSVWTSGLSMRQTELKFLRLMEYQRRQFRGELKGMIRVAPAAKASVEALEKFRYDLVLHQI